MVDHVNQVIYHIIILWVLNRGSYGRYGEILYQSNEVLLILVTVVEQGFMWMWVTT